MSQLSEETASGGTGATGPGTTGAGAFAADVMNGGADDPTATDAGVDAFDVFSRDCPSRVALEHITGRWGGLTLSALADDPLRFNALRRRVDGVSEKMLSQTLQALERDGLVIREAQPVNPPHVEYRLSPLGRQAAARLRDLIALVEEQMPEVLAARGRYDEGRGAGWQRGQK